MKSVRRIFVKIILVALVSVGVIVAFVGDAYAPVVRTGTGGTHHH